MQRKLLDQKGFSGVEIFLVVVVLALLGFTGYFLYYANKKTSDTLSAAAEIAQNSPPKGKSIRSHAGQVGNFKFKELGVQFTLPTALKGMSYVVVKLPDENGKKVNLLDLDDPHLTGVMNKCVDSVHGTNKTNGPLNFASIDRIEGQYDPVKEEGVNMLLKQFADFHILIGYPNGAICGSSDQALNNQWVTALKGSQSSFTKAFQSTATEIN